ARPDARARPTGGAREGSRGAARWVGASPRNLVSLTLTQDRGASHCTNRSDTSPHRTAPARARGDAMSGSKGFRDGSTYPFTDRVRRVLAMAREEAIRLLHDHVDAEHILLALTRDVGGMAVTVLTNLHIDPQQVRRRVEEVVPRGRPPIWLWELPYTSG